MARAILAGEVGTYTIVLQNIGNLDVPYVYFDVGIPDLLSNAELYNFSYALVSSNVRGGAEEVLADVPWAELDPAVNTDGQLADRRVRPEPGCRWLHAVLGQPRHVSGHAGTE